MPSRIAAPRPALVLAALAATVATVVDGPIALTPPEPARAGAIAAVAYGGQAFRATNHQRRTHDRRRLRHSDCLRRFAARQAARMADQQRVFHQDLGPVLRRCHADFVGENVAVGYPSGESVVDQGWMKSTDHRRNILETGFRRVEVVARRGANGQWYASQVFGHHR